MTQTFLGSIGKEIALAMPVFQRHVQGRFFSRVIEAVDLPDGATVNNYLGEVLNLLRDLMDRGVPFFVKVEIDWIILNPRHEEEGHFFMTIRSQQITPGGHGALIGSLDELKKWILEEVQKKHEFMEGSGNAFSKVHALKLMVAPSADPRGCLLYHTDPADEPTLSRLCGSRNIAHQNTT